MRTEKEMYDLIVGFAQRDERIRAVYMNGSRTNSNAQKDIFQDYDIVYVVTETASFINDDKWIKVFGDLLMIQEPEKNDSLVGMKMNFDRSYAYLMLFNDGNRIDLSLETKEVMLEGYLKDSLTVPLLDKDHILPAISFPSDESYWIKKPSEAQFMSCCNDFWWCLQNVGKGIWRDELPYAKQMFEQVIRGHLDEIVSWWVGIRYDFQISTGKMGKNFQKYLPEPYWSLYAGTYSNSDYENFWDSIFIACQLFQVLAIETAEELSFSYPIEDATNMTEFLNKVRTLPKDADKVFK
ncbi:aminoglycoside 6-adenylyltransferase [Peribacillus acanthi]|uniref:aminoglycoside 6-adenylyltransferase n=1 Tax=Peribacillus acanthi TaxID=2171554 RepID=UPI000D3E75F2|nr:aminoglycoside 6-adenylyltransferase [Peribacillus acanthi]